MRSPQETTPVAALLEALVEVDRTLADDLLLAVGHYTDSEMDDLARSGSPVGTSVTDWAASVVSSCFAKRFSASLVSDHCPN
jgi:hypothetical protein